REGMGGMGGEVQGGGPRWARRSGSPTTPRTPVHGRCLPGCGTSARAVLPPSLLVRECAELRRLLGQVLDVLGGQAAAVDADQFAAVLDALVVAGEYRGYRASLACGDCATYPAELCEDHQADLDAAEAYEDLAGHLGSAR